MADMDPYPGLKKKDKEFLESVNSKIRTGTYRDPESLRRNLKTMNNRLSGYQAKLSTYERSNTRKKIDTLSQARLRMQEAGIAPAPNLLAPVEESSGNSASLAEEPVLAPMGLEAIEELPENRESLQEATNQVVNVPIVWRKFVIDHIADEKKDIDRKIRNGEDIDEKWDFFGLVNAKSESETNKNGNGGHERFKSNEAEYIKKTLSDYIRSRVPPVVVPAAVPVAAPAPVAGSSKKVFKLKKSTFPINPSAELQTQDIVSDCSVLYHPCSGSIITEENPLNVIQKKLIELQRKQAVSHFKETPAELLNKKRSDLLLWFLNQSFTDPLSEINEDSLLNYQISGNPFSMSLFESYWDILIALGQLPGFEITKQRYMFDGKVESDLDAIPVSIPEGDKYYYSDIFKYLSKRDIQTSKIGGASDITVFNLPTTIKIQQSDPCSFYEGLGSDEPTDKPGFIFASAKKYKKEKSISKYDIQNIYIAAKKIDETKYNKKIFLLVSDEEAVKLIKKRANPHISEEAREIYGQEQMFSNLRALYDKIKHIERPITWDKIKYLFPLASESSKGTKNLRLQLHQKVTVDILKDRINEFRSSPGSHNRFLVGILPRGGKTYIAGGLVRELQPRNVVVLLGAKSETQSQFIEELFEYFNDFNEYKIVNVKDESEPSLQSGSLDPESKHIFVMSIELFKATENLDRRPLLKLLRGLLPGQQSPVDLFISDEAHLKQATRRAEDAVGHATAVGMVRPVAEEDDEGEPIIDDTLEKFSTIPIVYMTGTFGKPKSAFKIPDENTVVWSYANVQKAKMLDENIEYFTDIYGSYFTRALDYMIKTGAPDELNIIMKGYQTFPEMHLMETHFYPGVEDKLLTQGSEKGIPEMSKLFIINKANDFSNPRNWYLGFQFDKQMRRLINFLGPDYSQVLEGGSDDDKMTAVMTSIDRISQRTGDRLRNMTSDFVQHSQLWFFPKMTGNPLGKRMMAMAGIISRHKWFRDNFVIYAVSQVNWQNELRDVPAELKNDETHTVNIPVEGAEPATFRYYVSDSRKSLKQVVIESEISARAQKKGLIILAQNMLNLGISLPCVDIVVLLDGGENVDERIQKMYRALTPSPQKRDAYVVDLNYFRTVKAIMEYSIKEMAIRKKRNPLKEEKKSMLNDMFNTYSFNDDMDLFQTEDKRNEHIQELLDVQETKDYKLPTDLVDAGKQINRNVMGAINVDPEYFANIEVYKEESKKQKELIRDMKSRLTRAKPLSLADLFPGEPDEELKKKTKVQIKKGQEDYDNKRLAFYDIFSKLLRYGVFATNYASIGEFKENLESNDELKEEVREFLIKKHVVKETITTERLINELILPNLQKIIDADSKETSFAAMKGYVNDDTKYPAKVEEVLNYINEHLAPKDAERHKYGEVFTPMTLVHEMLDTLPEDVWKNPDLTWLDPANGMGNFPIAVFLRLFYGFRTKDGKYVGLMEEGEGKFNPGLTKVKPSETVRRRHIVQKMLFMSELNGKNVAISKKLFTKLADGLEPNIIKRDFLKDSDMEFNGKKVNEFDIVMGNPPYNSGTILRKKTRKIREDIKEQGLEGAKRESLWTKFVLKIFNNNIVKKDGYLLFITPINWFHPEVSGVRDIILSKQINFIKIIFLEQSKKIFNGKGELTTAIYLIHNQPVSNATVILDMIGKKETLKLDAESIIILAHNSIYAKICKKSKLFLNTDTVKSTAIKTCTPGPNKQIIGIYENGEIKYVKTSETHPLKNNPKIIINGYTFPRYFYDKDGEYGKFSKDGTNFIIVGDNLKKVQDYFDTKLSAMLLNYIKFTQKKIDPKYYPDVRTLPLDKINDETLSDYFGFTKEERAAIEATEYPKREYKFKEVTCAQLKGEKDDDGEEPESKEGGFRKPHHFTRRKSRN